MEARRRLYDSAIALISEQGYSATTMRELAARVGVSPGLLYRYFPSKHAVLMQLYEELSVEFATRAAAMPRGRWRDRFLFALKTSLDVLKPHRGVLSALAPVLVTDPEEGVFASRAGFSRRRVQEVFEAAVLNATDSPRPELAAALGRIFYLVHLAVLLWWLIDRSPRQRATDGLIELIERALPRAALALRLPFVRAFVRTGDGLMRQALLREESTRLVREQ